MDFKYSKPRRLVSIRGSFNACVFLPLRFLGAVASMASPASTMINIALTDETPLDRLKHDLENANPIKSFKMEKTGLLGRQLRVMAEERSLYGRTKTVRSCTVTFDSRAERDHYTKQIEQAAKNHNGFFLSSYTDIAGNVLDASLNLELNPMIKPFEHASDRLLFDSPKQSFLSRLFEKDTSPFDRQYRREMRKLGL